MHVNNYCFRNCGGSTPGLQETQEINLCAPEETISHQGGIRAIVFQGETDNQGENAAVSLILPELQNPHHPLFSVI